MNGGAIWEGHGEKVDSQCSLQDFLSKSLFLSFTNGLVCEMMYGVGNWGYQQMGI